MPCLIAKSGIIVKITSTTPHGLIAAPCDQSSSIQWYIGSYTTTGATGTAIGTGQSNTLTIVASQGVGAYAAYLCDTLYLVDIVIGICPAKMS